MNNGTNEYNQVTGGVDTFLVYISLTESFKNAPKILT